MLDPFPLQPLLMPALAILAATAIATYAVTKAATLSLVTGAIKAAIFISYFGYFFDGTYTVLDDWTYVRNGIFLLNHNVNFLNFYDNWHIAREASEGNDVFFYYLYNAFAFELFGQAQYFAPVALNLVLVALIAYLGYRLAHTEFGIEALPAKIFFFFLLFHPDILVWSNLLNIKDIFVLLTHVLLLTAIANIFKGKLLIATLIIAVILPILVLTRYYVIVLFAIALILSLAVFSRTARISAIAISSGLLIAIYLWFGMEAFLGPIRIIQQTFVNPIYGAIRFLLTPIPFNTDPEYTFLNLPAVLHWLFAPFLLVGVVKVWQLGTNYSRFFIIYFLTYIVVFSIVGEIQGPRQRVQLDFAIALFQFTGIMAAYTAIKFRPNRSNSLGST